MVKNKLEMQISFKQIIKSYLLRILNPALYRNIHNNDPQKVPFIKNWDQVWQIIYILISKDEPLILEIGAHYGELSKKFIRIFKSPTIYMFECDPRCLKKLKKEFTAFQKINIINKAVSNQVGKSHSFNLHLIQKFGTCQDQLIHTKDIEILIKL